MNSPLLYRSPHLGAQKFLSVGLSHPGCVRTVNEDRFLSRPDIGLWAVADGMGGHTDGEAASAAIIEALNGVSHFGSAYAYRDQVCGALRRVNSDLRKRSALPMADLCGSTIVTLIAHQRHYACIWAGDSRAYLLRDSVLKRLTRDHSVVQDLLDSGAYRGDPRKHARAHVLTRAVGAADALVLDSAYGLIEPNDRLLLCSDGVTNLLSEGELTNCLRRSPLQAGAQAIIDTALARGAPDNVTAVIAWSIAA